MSVLGCRSRKSRKWCYSGRIRFSRTALLFTLSKVFGQEGSETIFSKKSCTRIRASDCAEPGSPRVFSVRLIYIEKISKSLGLSLIGARSERTSTQKFPKRGARKILEKTCYHTSTPCHSCLHLLSSNIIGVCSATGHPGALLPFSYVFILFLQRPHEL